MKEINSRLSVTGATHQLRARLNKQSKEKWDKAKSTLEEKEGSLLSDSKFLEFLLNDLHIPSPLEIVK